MSDELIKIEQKDTSLITNSPKRESKVLTIEEKIAIARAPLPEIRILQPVYKTAGRTPYKDANRKLED